MCLCEMSYVCSVSEDITTDCYKHAAMNCNATKFINIVSSTDWLLW